MGTAASLSAPLSAALLNSAQRYRAAFSVETERTLIDLTTELDLLESRFHLAFEDDAILGIADLQALLVRLSDAVQPNP